MLDLNWSGPQPLSIDDLDAIEPLVLTHNSWNGRFSHVNCDWVLPRSFRVIGSLPLIHDQPSNSYTSSWRAGYQLALQRAWDRGEHDWQEPGKLALTPGELDHALVEGAPVQDGVRSLRVTGLSEADCLRIASTFPNLRSLMLGGNLGQLRNAGMLNRLGRLRDLLISNLFGMTKADCLLPIEVPNLEYLYLDSVPHEYASAMRSRWRSEAANGTSVSITKARKPEWVQENLENPLRDWDGREHISSGRFKKAVAQFKKTRSEVIEALSAKPSESTIGQLENIGREYAIAFNRLDGRSPFIETEEREELFAALASLTDKFELELGRPLTDERLALLSGAEDAREW